MKRELLKQIINAGRMRLGELDLGSWKVNRRTDSFDHPERDVGRDYPTVEVKVQPVCPVSPRYLPNGLGRELIT